MEHFHTHILAQHGYTTDSPPFVALLERMAALTTEERRGFLQFVTGAPALPVGAYEADNVSSPRIMTCRLLASFQEVKIDFSMKVCQKLDK